MLAALTFLTIVGRGAAPEPRAVPWFPVVGALLGAAVAGVWWGAAELWPPAIAAMVVVAADLGFTGLLHLDGLADSGDGLLPPVDRQRRLEILRTPEVGAFGMASVVVVLGLRWSSLAAIEVEPWLPIAVWAASRALVGGALGLLPYARSSGLAQRFIGRRGSLISLAGILPAVILAGSFGGLAGLAAVGGVVAGVGAVLALSMRRLSGFTGDTLGAALLVGETAGLLVAAARW